MNKGAFSKVLSDRIDATPEMLTGKLVGHMMNTIVSGCDAAMPRRSVF